MFRMTRIVPSTFLTLAALSLAAPVAQAKPYVAPPGGTFVSPSVQSTQDFNNYSPQSVHRDVGSGVVTTGDRPLANPVQLPNTLAAPVNVPTSSGNSFDWTAAAIGAGLGGILMLMLAVGLSFRRRGQLAA
jgi:hypothetical protein